MSKVRPARFIPWMSVFDTHGDMIDRAAERVVHEFAREFKPKIKIHGGDYADLRPFREGANDNERQSGVEDDVDSAVAFMRAYKPTHVLDGNHDYRLLRATQGKDERLAEFAARLMVDLSEAMGAAQRFPWCKRRGVYQLGDTRFIHGYHSGLTAARQAGMAYGNVVMGHVHRFDSAPIARIERTVGRSCGCICRVEMDYNRSQVNTLAQENGFVYGLHFPTTGRTLVWEARAIDGVWFLPSEFREFSREA